MRWEHHRKQCLHPFFMQQSSLSPHHGPGPGARPQECKRVWVTVLLPRNFWSRGCMAGKRTMIVLWLYIWTELSTTHYEGLSDRNQPSPGKMRMLSRGKSRQRYYVEGIKMLGCWVVTGRREVRRCQKTGTSGQNYRGRTLLERELEVLYVDSLILCIATQQLLIPRLYAKAWGHTNSQGLKRDLRELTFQMLLVKSGSQGCEISCWKAGA